MLRDLRFRLRALFRREAMERELDDELRFHLDKAIEAHVQAGHPRPEAERLARLELGGVEAVKEECREARGVRLVEDLVTDVRYGVRVLRKSPAFTVIAIVTLALGIGANSAMFSVVNTVLRQPLPYPEPHELVRLHASKPDFERGSISFPNFLDWQAGNRTFSAMAVSRSGAFTLSGVGNAERVSADLISADYFSVLGVRPILGRTFARGEDLPGGETIALLGEKLWKRKFGAARDVVGKPIILDGNSFIVVGVMPSRTDLRAVSGGRAPDLYIPIGQVAPGALKQRAAGLGIHGIGRLAPGVTVQQARADLAGVTQALATTYPDTNKSVGATVDPLPESVVGFVRPYILLLLGAVGLVLLIACVNVANLLLARSAGRSREFGIRLALGASVGRLVRQLLTESLLLALAGGALGLLVAWWCIDAVLVVLPRVVPRVEEVGIDTGVLVFTMLAAILAGVLSGLTPALKAARPDLNDTLKEGGRGPSTTRYRAQAVFVVVQMAMALVLLVGASLLVRTLMRLSNENPGYQADGVVTMGLSLAPSLREAEPARIRAELRRVESALAAAPGVAAATFGWGSLPIEGDDQIHFWRVDRPEPASQNDMPWVQRFIVGPDYLTTMRVPLVRGRFFSDRDDEHAPPVVVVDEVFAKTYFPGEDPIGKRISLGEPKPSEIVGVVAHIKQFGLDRDETTSVRSQMYQSFRQFDDESMAEVPNGITVTARARGDTGGAVASLRRAVQGLGGEAVMFRVRTANEVIASHQATRRFAMYVLVAFAVLALLLSCIGIYGVVSYVVAQRTSEIGIRMALGAQPGHIMRLVLRQGGKLALAGVALGIGAAIAVAPSLGGLLYGVPALDPVTFVVVPPAVVLIALAAMMVPARRAMRVDPMHALRAD